MKQRILRGWNIQRVLYVVLGVMVIIQSIGQHQWPGIVFGGYFASMGIFAFGCAGGNCYGGTCYPEPNKKSATPEGVDKRDS